MPRPLANVIHFPGPPQTASITSRTLLFFITGNPGLIEYYRTFLSLVHDQLTPANGDDRIFDIYGANLVGFETGDARSAVQRRDGWE